MRGLGAGGGRGATRRAAGGDQDDEVVGKAYDARLARKLWPFVAPVKGLVAATLVLSVVTSIAQIVQPLLLKQGIDAHMVTGEGGGLVVVGGLFLLALVVELVGAGAQLYTSNLAGQEVTRSLRAAIYGHTTSRPVKFFESNPIGRLVTRITSDPEAINELFASGAINIATDVIKMAAMLAVMLVLSPTLTLVALAMVPVTLAASAYFRANVRDAYRKVRYSVARLNAYLQESLQGMIIVRLFSQEARTARQFDERSAEYRDNELAGVVYESGFSAAVELIGTIAVALLFWVGGGQKLRDAATFGTVVMMIDYAQKFYAPLRELSAKYTVLQAAMAAAEKIWQVLDDDAQVPESASPKPFPEDWDTIRVEDVTFRYLADRAPALQGVSFTVRRGERVAIVGATGSGKSSLAKLLVRFYDPEGGRITIGGVDIRELRKTELRRKVTLLLQDSYLFSGDLRHNLTLGDDVDPAALAAAVSAAQLDDVVARLPGGLDARLTERGASLSAGERQLVSLARALAIAPPVLVLDEATASIDPVAEERIQAALHRLLAGRTAIIIAHRLSTIREVDRILVIHQGQVREEGSHDVLIAKDGIYARLHRLQLARVAVTA